MKKSVLTVICILTILQFSPLVHSVEEGKVTLFYRSVTVYAPAVAETEQGMVGVATTITVTVQNGTGCSGKVFVETVPLTEVDMQGSARLAVTVACSLAGVDPSNYDFFFVIKTPSPIIGGPSAGAIMTIATISALEGWDLDNKTMMTGMINPDGSIGPVGGIKEKIDAAHSVGAKRFLIPKGQSIVYENVIENVGGWLVYTKKQINVTEYAMEKYGMEVVEVEDINDALYYFTGYRFEEEEFDKNITTENYTTSMLPLAEHLLNRAKDSYNNASTLFNETKYSIPNQYPFFTYRTYVEQRLKEAKEDLHIANESFESKMFYSSMSKSFQSLINSRFVIYACQYFSSENKKQFVEDMIDLIGEMVNNSKKLASGAEIKGLVSLQCVGAAQKRLYDAQDKFDTAVKSYRQGDYVGALYNLAFCAERCLSIGWWINISKQFEDKPLINGTQLQDIATKYLDLAKNSVTYSKIILREIGENSDLLNDAEQTLMEAEKQKKTHPAASLFSSLEATAEANLAMELIGVEVGGESIKERLERTKDKAAAEIGKCRGKGIEPVLAVSYYEYAESLEGESAINSMLDYRYAQMIAGALRLAVSPIEKKTSRFEGIPPINPANRVFPSEKEIISYLIWTVAILGIILLAIVAMVSIISSERRFRRDFPPELW